MAWVEQKLERWINEFTPPPPLDVPHVNFSKNYDNVDFTTGVEVDSYYGLVRPRTQLSESLRRSQQLLCSLVRRNGNSAPTHWMH